LQKKSAIKVWYLSPIICVREVSAQRGEEGMIEKINKVFGVNPVSAVKQKKSPNFEDALKFNDDDIAVSSFAREMANISNELAKVPEIREDKVRELKRQIEEGSYKPDLEVLAERLIWAGINKSEDNVL
jgi:negative regulator of flagellin synthesis FlgM